MALRLRMVRRVGETRGLENGYSAWISNDNINQSLDDDSFLLTEYSNVDTYHSPPLFFNHHIMATAEHWRGLLITNLIAPATSIPRPTTSIFINLRAIVVLVTFFRI